MATKKRPTKRAAVVKKGKHRAEPMPAHTKNYLYSYWMVLADQDINALRRVARVIELSPKYGEMFGGEDDEVLKAIANRLEEFEDKREG